MQMQTDFTLPVHVSRPLQHWAFGVFILALLTLFFVLAIREGEPLLVWRAWPAYAVTAIFAPLALLMLSARAVTVVVDARSHELVITQHTLISQGSTCRIRLTAVTGVDVTTCEGVDGDSYHVDVVETGGRRHHATAHQINSRKRAECMAASIRTRIAAARGLAT